MFMSPGSRVGRGRGVIGGSFIALSIYPTVNQPVTTAAFTKVVFSTTEYDTDGGYSFGTSRFTPKNLGLWTIKASVTLLSASTNTAGLLAVYKNGVVYRYGQRVSNTGATRTNIEISCDVLISLPTDFIELFILPDSPASGVVVASASPDVPQSTWFNAKL